MHRCLTDVEIVWDGVWKAAYPLFISGRNSAPNGVINMHIINTKKDQSSKITFKIFIHNFFKTIHESNTEDTFVFVFLHKCT